MPQGFRGTPATFLQLIEKAVGVMHLIQILVHLDGIIVFGKILKEHEHCLLRGLDCLQEVGLKVSIDKYEFCQPQVKCVCHIVTESGITTDPEKVEVVANKNDSSDLKSQMGFLGF